MRLATDKLNHLQSPRLDAEILLAHVLEKNRVYLIAHDNETITLEQKKKFETLIERRKNNEPIAYITGYKEFWSLKLQVTPNCLIPRPETELLVNLIINLFNERTNLNLVDLGCGSGAIALALASEKPNWTILATDKNLNALILAASNAKQLNADGVAFLQGNWCAPFLAQSIDIIVSNPPYIALEDEYSEDIRYEPASALFSEDRGLADINEIIRQAKYCLRPSGWLFLEHGSQQAKQVRHQLTCEGYHHIHSYKDYAEHDRVTIACLQ